MRSRVKDQQRYVIVLNSKGKDHSLKKSIRRNKQTSKAIGTNLKLYGQKPISKNLRKII